MSNPSTLFFITILVIAGTIGELLVSRAMKQIGEIKTFTLSSILSTLLRAFRVKWMWAGYALMVASFLSMLILLSWEKVSFVVPVSALTYVIGAVGGKLFFDEQINRYRWIGILLVSFGVGLVWIGQ